MTETPIRTDDTGAAPATRLETPHAAIPLLLAFCALMYLVPLGAMPLWEPDEPRYAEVAREMLESGDFVTPRWNYVRYLKKPPLLFWMTAGSFALLGTSEFAARLPCALAGIASAVVCYLLARSMFGGLAGLLAGGILATSLLHIAMARVVRFDGPLTLLVSLSLLLFWLGHREPDHRRAARLFVAMYPVLALAMLMKGPVGPGLVGLIVLIYLLLTRNLRLVSRMRLPLGVLIFIAVALPWFACVEKANPGVAASFFLGENIGRFAAGTGGHREPAWFYLPVLAAGMFPWTALLPAAIAVGIRDCSGDERQRADGALLCLIWIGVTFGFFSLSGSKLEPYVLPAWPALAALIGSFLAGCAQRGSLWPRWRWAYAASLAGVLASVLALGVGGAIPLPTARYVPSTEGASLAVLLLVATGVACAVVLAALLRSRAKLLVLMAIGMGAFMAAIVALWVGIGTERSLKPLAARAKAELRPGDALVAYQCFRRELCFYAQHRLIVVRDAPGEFDFDREGARRDGMWVPEPSGMLDLLRSDKRVVAFAERDDYEQLRRECEALYELGERRAVVLFSNRPSRRSARQE